MGKAHTHVLPQQGCLSFPSPGVGAGWTRFRRCPPYLPLSSLSFPRSLPHTPSHSPILISPSFLLFCYFLLFSSSFIFLLSQPPADSHSPLLNLREGGRVVRDRGAAMLGGGGKAPVHSCLPLRFDSADPQEAKSWIFVIPGGRGGDTLPLLWHLSCTSVLRLREGPRTLLQM